MSTNMHPADELLFIRQRIKEFQVREDELKSGFKSGDLETAGQFSVVTVTKRKSKRFDRKAAEAELGSLSRFEVETESTVIRAEELANPDEA